MKFTNKKEILIIIIIVLISALIYGVRLKSSQQCGKKAEIYYGQKLVMTVDLDRKEERTFSLPQNEHVIFHLYKDGSICFEESDCPDKICIHSGRLSHVGETAACLPNKIILKITSDGDKSDDEVDIIVK